MKLLRIIVVLMIVAISARESQIGAVSRVRARDVNVRGPKTRNVIVVTTDGLRWQEVFGGAEKSLMNRENGHVADVIKLRESFDRDSPEERRKALMPFFWGVIAERGAVFGDPSIGDDVKVKNGRNFSYPGYNEIFTGYADPRIDSNNKVPNHNVSILEWLNRRDEYKGKIAAFGSWDVFPFILNQWRSKVPVTAAWKTLKDDDLSDEEKMIGRLKAETPRLWEECCYDSYTFISALAYMKRKHPNVLYIGLGETDEFGHAGRYDHYLNAANRVDDDLRQLWETIQSIPEYQDSTTLIITTDHGRGDAPVEWKNHGAKVAGSDRIWMAVLGPDTPHRPLSLSASKPAKLTQGQVASTVAAFLGLNFPSAYPNAAPPIAEVLPQGVR